MIGVAYAVILALFVAAVAAHAIAAWWRSANAKTDELLSGEPLLNFRRVPAQRRRSPDVQVTRVHRVLDDMPHH